MRTSLSEASKRQKLGPMGQLMGPYDGLTAVLTMLKACLRTSEAYQAALRIAQHQLRVNQQELTSQSGNELGRYQSIYNQSRPEQYGHSCSLSPRIRPCFRRPFSCLGCLENGLHRPPMYDSSWRILEGEN